MNDQKAPVFLTRLRVENYRSIGFCDVRPGPLTVLAGPNAAGKSNVLDALRFVRDAVRASPARALEPRGGLDEVLHRRPAGRQADSFRIHLEVGGAAHGRVPFNAAYTLEIGTDPEGDPSLPVVRSERLLIDGVPQTEPPYPQPRGEEPVAFREDTLLPSRANRANREVRALVSALGRMRFYEFLTPELRALDDTPGSRGGQPLSERGGHLGRVLNALERHYPWAKEAIDGYLSTMIDNAVGVDGVEVREANFAFVVGRFLQADGHVTKVDRRSLSDGTLRLTAVLAALFQPLVLDGAMPLIGVEEPEISLHPPMLGALYDALVAASRNTQVIVTTQSADLLDNAAADPAHLLVVRDDGAGTTIGPIDETGLRLLADGVLTLPELLRSGEMRPLSPPEREEHGEGEQR
ncbi:AAA family ATPase [Streptomyces chartreusis]|uniref:AAA family ATPase n=1 Tax=Streptomyces chartreusis TaxID=1969 RepID=UPI003679D4A6